MRARSPAEPNLPRLRRNRETMKAADVLTNDLRVALSAKY